MATIKSRAAMAALALTATVLLSACGGNPIKNAVDGAVNNAVDKGVEKAIENAAGEDVDLNVSVDGSAVDLPSGFPSEVKLPEGSTLISSVTVDEGWSLVYSETSDSAAHDLAAKYKADSAWETTYESVAEGMSSWIFTDGNFQVLFLVTGTDSEYAMGVTVSSVDG